MNIRERLLAVSKEPARDVIAGEILLQSFIIEETARFFGTEPEQLFENSKSRKTENIVPRQVAQTLLYEETRLSFSEIGRIWGKDHATMINSRKAIENRAFSSRGFREDLLRLKSRVKAKGLEILEEGNERAEKAINEFFGGPNE